MNGLVRRIAVLAIVALPLLSGQVVPIVNASVAGYTASAFSQYCAQNPNICNKVDASSGLSLTVSCPQNGQVISAVYVHGGDGQTVYLLPDVKWGYSYSNSNSTVTVTKLGQHDISWVGVVCANAAPTPTPTPNSTPTPCPTPSASPKATPSPTPVTTPKASPSPIPTPTPKSSPTPTPSSNPTPTPSPVPTPTPLVSPTPTPTPDPGNPTPTPTPTSIATPSPTPTPTSTSSTSSGGTTLAIGGGEVLGAAVEYAATGNVTNIIANLVGSLGGILTAAGAIVYARAKNE